MTSILDISLIKKSEWLLDENSESIHKFSIEWTAFFKLLTTVGNDNFLIMTHALVIICIHSCIKDAIMDFCDFKKLSVSLNI